MKRGAIVCVITCIVGACDMLPGSYTYKAEVGYYNDGKETWYVGEINPTMAVCRKLEAILPALTLLQIPSGPFLGPVERCRAIAF